MSRINGRTSEGSGPRSRLHTSADGRSHTCREWAEIIGVSYPGFKKRVQLWGLERAISIAPHEQYGRVRTLWHDGYQRSITGWATHFDIPVATFSEWVNKHGAVEAFRRAEERPSGHSHEWCRIVGYFLSKYNPGEWDADRWTADFPREMDSSGPAES